MVLVGLNIMNRSVYTFILTGLSKLYRRKSVLDRNCPAVNFGEFNESFATLYCYNLARSKVMRTVGLGEQPGAEQEPS